NIETASRGVIKYRIPDNFIMLYSQPQDQIIYSDGKVLKIYVPELNVLGEQNLEHFKPGFLVSGKSSLYYMRNKFNISFHKSNKPVLINNMPYYILLLEQKDVTSGFKKILLYVNQFWVIVKAEATTLEENFISISFSDITLNTKMTDNEFEFNLPVNTQTIKNPLLLKIEGD
ncbi:MAG: outer-membrane lipoprotein carrier protein LolA, partial [bacterium]|nr:outer-membrane lipoprotein carrier protein LolA [bacterium]